MNSSRPYLFRALYEWIVDNECTPHLLVNSDYPQVRVPPGFASDGQIVLNVSPSAVRHLEMDNEAVSFRRAFWWRAAPFIRPLAAVLGDLCREKTARAWSSSWSRPARPTKLFDGDEEGATPQDEPPKPGGRPSLKVVK